MPTSILADVCIPMLGILMGGVLEVNARDIECKVYGQTIPRKIRVNLQGLTIGKKIRVDEVGVCRSFVL